MSITLLMVEDNVRLAANLKKGLVEQGHSVSVARSGADARAHLDAQVVDVVLLDLGLPDMDGSDLIADIRSRYPHTAILITSARDTVDDRIQTLHLGGDDYLTKPFSFAELLARIEAVCRRIQRTTDSHLVSGPVRLDLRSRQAWVLDEEVPLPPREFALLAYFMERPNQTVSRSMLARDVWRVNDRLVNLDNTIDVYISRLRDQLKGCTHEVGIRTLRGVGFQWEPPET